MRQFSLCMAVTKSGLCRSPERTSGRCEGAFSTTEESLITVIETLRFAQGIMLCDLYSKNDRLILCDDDRMLELGRDGSVYCPQ